MKATLIFTFLTLLIGCGRDRNIDHSNNGDCSENSDQVRIFVFTDYGLGSRGLGTRFKLWVNDSLMYDGPFIRGYKLTPYRLPMIAACIEKSDTTKTFRIRMKDRDTTFVHNMAGVDKLAISVLSRGDYVIFDSHEKQAWYLE